jgi:enoyl-CoA hydratase
LPSELGTALLAFDAQDEIGCIIVTGSEKAFAAGADISVMAGFDYMDVFNGEFITCNWGDPAPHPQAGHCGGGGLRAGRRL